MSEAHQAVCSFLSLAMVLQWLSNSYVDGGTGTLILVVALQFMMLVATIMHCWVPSLSSELWILLKRKALLPIQLLLLITLVTMLRGFSADGSTSTSLLFGVAAVFFADDRMALLSILVLCIGNILVWISSSTPASSYSPTPTSSYLPTPVKKRAPKAFLQRGPRRWR